MSRGLGNNSGQKNEIYVTCANGVFSKRVPEPTKGSITRKIEKGPNIGKEIHEEHFEYFEGQLVSITTNESENYGKQWVFKFDISETPSDKKFVVYQVGYDNGYAINILSRLPNANLEKDIRMSAYAFTDENGKEKKGITLFQEGKKIQPAYTKDAPNGLPQMKKVKVNSKEVWDKTDMLEFLENMVNTEIIPNLPKEVDPLDTVAAFEAEKPAIKQEEEEDALEEQDGDAPW